MEKKGNILTIIGVALLVVNLVLSSVIVFVSLPTMSKTNKIINQVAKVMELELEPNTEESKQIKVPINQLEVYSIDEQITVRINSNDDSDVHILRFKAAIAVNKKAKDAKKITPQLEEKKTKVISDLFNIASKYSYEEIKQGDSAEVMAKEMLKSLQESFDTKSIVDVYFKEFLYN